MSIISKDDLKACRGRVNKPTPETHLDNTTEFQKDKLEVRRSIENYLEEKRLRKMIESDYE